MHIDTKAAFEITGKKKQDNFSRLYHSATLHIKDGWSLSHRPSTRINFPNKLFLDFLGGKKITAKAVVNLATNGLSPTYMEFNMFHPVGKIVFGATHL